MNELNTNQLVYIGIVFVLSVVIFLAVANLLGGRRHGGYAGCTRKENGKSKIYNAYRIIMNIDDSRLEVDHINGDKWDNRKCNLRIVTHADNMKNKKLDKRNKSGYTGVKETKAGTWNAQIYCNGKYINLGTYKAKEDAIKARKEAEEKYFGEFTHKN